MFSLIVLLILTLNSKINGDIDAGLIFLALVEFLLTAIVVEAVWIK